MTTATATVTLLPHHQAQIAASGIDPSVAQQRGYRSTLDQAEVLRLGFAPYQCRVPALLLPSTNTAGENGRYQLRPDQPRIGTNGKPIKYETPAGATMWLDVPAAVQPVLSDAHVPLWITEGFKKADAAVSAGLACIALLGVWSWRALAEWAHVALKDRDVFIAFDSDLADKPEVRDALTALSAFLTSLGARVRIVRLPPGPDGAKVGLDDYLAAGHTARDLEALAGPVARPYHEPADDEAEQLRQHNHILRERAAALERELSALRQERTLERQALANPEVREEVAVGLALIDDVTDRAAKGRKVGDRVKIYLGDIAERAGVSPQTAGRHVQRIAALGVVGRQTVHLPGGLKDRHGRWDKKPKDEIWIELDSREAALRRLAHAEAIAGALTVEAGRRRKHGGARLRCRQCGGDDVVYRPYCRHCKIPIAPADDDPTVIQDETRWAAVDAAIPATATQLERPIRSERDPQAEERPAVVQVDLFQPTVNQVETRCPEPVRTFRVVPAGARAIAVKPPQERIDELAAIETDALESESKLVGTNFDQFATPPAEGAPSQPSADTVIQVESRLEAKPPPAVPTTDQVDRDRLEPPAQCSRCGGSPVVPYHTKCQQCCIGDASPRKAGVML